MNFQSSFVRAGPVVLAAMLAGCGGGGGSSADVVAGAPVPATVVTGPDSFLLFPNPQLQPDGSAETNTVAYAEAYYAAIDPFNRKDTLAKWKAANGFDTTPATPTGALGEAAAVFGDVRDLGYGRRMRGRQNADGSIAATVENYLVTAGSGYSYSTLNLDAAVVRDGRWHVGTNAIEYSAGPNGGARFAKFYTFNPTTGERLLMANLDGRGKKAMPGICINCHGGRGDPLTPIDSNTGKPLFPLVQNAASHQRGDTQARMQMFNVDSFDFSGTPGYTRPELEASLKTLNKMILCTYPLAAPSAAPEDACRPAADPNEWQGTADTLIKAAYGGAGMPNPAFSDIYVPTGWIVAGQSSLYSSVVQHSCRTCHILRGTGNQPDINFIDYANFRNYSDRIRFHVFERGNMPLAKIVSEKFWNTNMADTLAIWLEGVIPGYTLHDSSLGLLKPGRPIADPGPGRVVRQGSTILSAAGSVYANSYNWSITANPGGAASLTNPDSPTPTFTATADGSYVLQLIAGNGTDRSPPALLTMVVKNALAPAPSAIRFADIKTVLQSAGAGCTQCHTPTPLNVRPPIYYTDTDRNGDGVVNATDDLWFYKELRGRINFTDIAGSPLLRKPSNNHHNGGQRPGFDTSLPPGDPARAEYDLFLNWMLNGAPQ